MYFVVKGMETEGNKATLKKWQSQDSIQVGILSFTSLLQHTDTRVMFIFHKVPGLKKPLYCVLF